MGDVITLQSSASHLSPDLKNVDLSSVLSTGFSEMVLSPGGGHDHTSSAMLSIDYSGLSNVLCYVR